MKTTMRSGTLTRSDWTVFNPCAPYLCGTVAGKIPGWKNARHKRQLVVTRKKPTGDSFRFYLRRIEYDRLSWAVKRTPKHNGLPNSWAPQPQLEDSWNYMYTALSEDLTELFGPRGKQIPREVTFGPFYARFERVKG